MSADKQAACLMMLTVHIEHFKLCWKTESKPSCWWWYNSHKGVKTLPECYIVLSASSMNKQELRGWKKLQWKLKIVWRIEKESKLLYLLLNNAAHFIIARRKAGNKLQPLTSQCAFDIQIQNVCGGMTSGLDFTLENLWRSVCRGQ